MCQGSSAVPDASAARIGPARRTVNTVEPNRRPPASATSPPAMAVVAMEAISHGARPMAVTPSRRGPAVTRWATDHDSAGKTVMPAIRATDRRRQADRQVTERARLDGQRGEEDQDHQEDVDALVAHHPAERALHGQPDCGRRPRRWPAPGSRSVPAGRDGPRHPFAARVG